MATRTRVSAGEVHEHEGLLWKPLPGATSTFEELIAARVRMMEIFKETNWSPWLKEERQPDLDAAMAIFDEWTRAEPDFRQMTDAEVDQWMADMDAEFDARRAADETRFAEAREHYDPEREAARLAVLEQEQRLRRAAAERPDYEPGGRYAGWSERSLAEHLAEIDRMAAHANEVIARLSPLVGDPEEVIDARGMKPRDRRPLNLAGYSAHRHCSVIELRENVPELKDRIRASQDREEKSKLRMELQRAESRLRRFMEVPQLKADEMCADCEQPLYQHGWVLSDNQYPCPAWPEHRAHMERVRAMLVSMFARHQLPEPPPAPKPQPLAVVPSGLPIAEAIARLQDLQQQFPDAEVKRGRAGRFEIWPARPGGVDDSADSGGSRT